MKVFILLFVYVFSFSLKALDTTSYLKLGKALATDDLKKSILTFKEVCKKIEKSGNFCELKKMTLKDLRENFKGLSAYFIKDGTYKKEGLKLAYCPMAEASWLQEKGEINNPYYGEEMLTCGEFKE